MEFTREEREFNQRLYRENCECMVETFEFSVCIGELSRMPTEAEIKKVQEIMKEKIDAGKWGDSTGELFEILCNVSDIKHKPL